MNSSSAFSNVLPVSPIQPASSPASARSLNDDSDGPGFKRAMADVRSEQEVKPKEPCAKKLAAADKSSKAKAAPEDVPAVCDKTISAAAKEAGKTEAKGESEEAVAVADESKKVDALEPLLSIDALAVAAPVQPVAEVALADLDSAGEGAVQNLDNPALDVGMAPIAIDANATLANPEIAPESVPAIEPLEVSVAATPAVEAIEVADPALAAAVSPAAVAVIPESIAAAGLAPVKNTEVKLDNLAAVTDASAAAADGSVLASDDPLASADPKAVFEKMLQAIANNTGASGNGGSDSQKTPDLAATIAALATSTAADSPAAAPGLESLSRGAEVQLPAARNFVVQTAVPINVGQPSWSQAVGEKVLWLAAQNVQSAEIILDPPEVGPMQVKVSVHQEQTSISFTSHNAGVRELLDQNLGRLRDMFSEQGLNLVNVDVSDKSFQRQQGDGSEQQGQAARGEPEEEESLQAVSAIVQQRLVDHYA